MQKNLQAKSWLERGTQTERNLNEQVQMLKGNLLLSRILYQLYQQLESSPSTLVKNLEEQIADLHLAQFELSQQRDQLFQKTQYLDNLIANSSEPVSEEDRASLSKLLDTRISLLDQLNRQLDAQLTNAISLQLTQQQLARIYSSIEFTLQQHLLGEQQQAHRRQVVHQLAGPGLKQASDWVLKPDWSGWGEMLLPVSLLAFPLLLVGGLLIWKRPALVERQKKITRIWGVFARTASGTPACPVVYCAAAPAGQPVHSGRRSLAHLLRPAQSQADFPDHPQPGARLPGVQRLPGGDAAGRHCRDPFPHCQSRAAGQAHQHALPVGALAAAHHAVDQGGGRTLVAGQRRGGAGADPGPAGAGRLSGVPHLRARIKGEASMQQSITAIALALAPVALMVLVGLGYYTALKLTGRLIESFYLIII